LQPDKNKEQAEEGKEGEGDSHKNNQPEGKWIEKPPGWVPRSQSRIGISKI
jgi:hypothetical protein